MMLKPHEMTFADFVQAAEPSGGMNRWPYRGQGKEVQSYNVYLAGAGVESLPKSLREQEFKDATLEALTEKLGLNPKSFRDNVRVAEMVALRHAYMSNCLEQSSAQGLSPEVNAEYFKLTDFFAHPVMQELVNAQLEQSTALNPAMAQAREKLGKELSERAAGGVNKGEIVSQNSQFTVQDVGGGYVVAHENNRLTELPEVGQDVIVSYYRGRGHVYTVQNPEISNPFIDPQSGALAVALDGAKGGTEVLLFSGLAAAREFSDAHQLDGKFMQQVLDLQDEVKRSQAAQTAEADKGRQAVGDVYKDTATGAVALNYREGATTYTAVFHSADALAVNAKAFGAGEKHIQQAAGIEGQTPPLDAVQSDLSRVSALYGPETDVKRANLLTGRYSGPVVGEGRFHVAQDLGRGAVVLHDKRDLDKVPKLGDKLGVTYSGGRGVVNVRQAGKAVER